MQEMRDEDKVSNENRNVQIAKTVIEKTVCHTYM